MAPSEIKMLRRLSLTGSIQFDFQVVFGYYIADFVFPDRMLIMELDGKSHNKQKEYDANRDKYLTSLGFVVWRVPNTEVGKFDLEKIINHEHRPGYPEAILASRGMYQRSRNQQPSEEAYHQQNRQVTERTEKRRKRRPVTDLTPRLVKSDRLRLGMSDPHDAEYVAPQECNRPEALPKWITKRLDDKIARERNAPRLIKQDKG